MLTKPTRACSVWLLPACVVPVWRLIMDYRRHLRGPILSLSYSSVLQFLYGKPGELISPDRRNELPFFAFASPKAGPKLPFTLTSHQSGFALKALRCTEDWSEITGFQRSSTHFIVHTDAHRSFTDFKWFPVRGVDSLGSIK